MSRPALVACVLAASVVASARAAADEPPKSSFKVTPMGYVEAYYAYNLGRPSNGITNYRGYDNRHNSFTLSNAALGATFEAGPVGGKVLLQVGSTGATYYGAEPARAGAAGANASDAELWRYVQSAYLSYRLPVGRGVVIRAGIFAAPLGFESFAVKDHWTWSRSNLFFGLPGYYSAVGARWFVDDHWAATLTVLNGWNAIVDNNPEKSLQAQLTYKGGDDVFVSMIYLGGVERAPDAPEGRYWRNLFDVNAEARVSSWLSVAGQVDAGFEPNRMGTARWWAVAAAARAHVAKPLYVVLRGDRFTEHAAGDGTGRTSTPIFWGGAEWVTEATMTLDLRPHDNVSVRLEQRLDVADRDLYFARDVRGDGSAASPFVPNKRFQETILLGATAWF